MEDLKWKKGVKCGLTRTESTSLSSHSLLRSIFGKYKHFHSTNMFLYGRNSVTGHGGKGKGNWKGITVHLVKSRMDKREGNNLFFFHRLLKFEWRKVSMKRRKVPSIASPLKIFHVYFSQNFLLTLENLVHSSLINMEYSPHSFPSSCMKVIWSLTTHFIMLNQFTFLGNILFVTFTIFKPLTCSNMIP